jgi:hypothetical protein
MGEVHHFLKKLLPLCVADFTLSGLPKLLDVRREAPEKAVG